MSTTWTAGFDEEHETQWEAEQIKAFTDKGGPIDSSGNPIIYYGKRGALAGHLELLGEYMASVPELDMIMSRDTVGTFRRTRMRLSHATLAPVFERGARVWPLSH